MPVSPHYAGAYNINLIACWLLLLLCPAKVSNTLNNCSFIEGHILEFVCHGLFDRALRLQYKDHIPVTDAPYNVWQRADYFGSSMLLIVFYEGPLSDCFNLVLDDGKFYCDGRNYPLQIEDTILVNCIPFQFTYADELHKRCKRHYKRPSRKVATISSVIVYMESNILVGSRSSKSLHCSHLLLFIQLICTMLLRFHF